MSDDVARRLTALRAAYASELPARVLELRASVDRARVIPHDDGTLEDASLRAHRLAGSAGSYGLPDVGACARRLERALERVRAGDAAAWSDVDAALAATDLAAGPSRA